MTTSQAQLLESIRDALATVEERYPGYRPHLLDTVAQIVFLERENLEQRTAIAKKVRDKCEALGALIERHSVDASTSESAEGES